MTPTLRNALTTVFALLLVASPAFAAPAPVPLPEAQYREEHKRTKPDLVLYLPSGELQSDSENQQIVVTPLPSGDFLATWTQATRENHPDQRIVVARSADQGKTWSKPVVIDGATPEQIKNSRGKFQASWSFFVAAPQLKRVYLFYNKNTGRTDARDDTTGVVRFRFSDDEGRTWSEPFDHLKMARGGIDHKDPSMPVNYVACYQSFADAKGVPMATFTRWGSGSADLFNVASEIWFLRFDNILTEPDPLKLRMTTLPDGATNGLRVPNPNKPAISVAQEGAAVTLPDGRLFVVMRTLQGCIYWSQSRDDGKTWTDPAPLLYHDAGPRVLNPISPAPLYQYAPGKYFLIFNNNDGTAFGGKGPGDYTKNRRPTFLVTATFDASAAQPLRFATPKPLMDTDGVILGPSRRVEPCSYPSYFSHAGHHYLWYPDRKHFVLGKLLDAYLD